MFYIMCHLQVLLKVLISHLLKRKVNSQEEWLQARTQNRNYFNRLSCYAE